MRTLKHGGHRLRFYDQGSGDPIVFVHNGALSHRLWDYQLEYFEHSHRVVAPDLLGLGGSDRPEILYTAEDYVAQVEQLVDHLGLDRFDLVGCCLGGSVALELARRDPRRVRTLSVVTAATPNTIAAGPFGPFEALSTAGSRRRRALGRLCDSPLGRWAMTRAFYRYQCGPRALADPSFKAHVTRLYRSEGQWRVFCNTSYEGFAALDHFRKPPGFPPTLMMWGERNPILPARAGRELAAAVEPEREEFWADCGYMLMRERPDDTNRVLEEFLAAAANAPEAIAS